MTATVTPIDTPLMRWRLLHEAVERCQCDPNDENRAAVDEAYHAFCRAYRRGRPEMAVAGRAQ